MHYYKKNIGDYHKKAGRLSMLQHGAYTLLLDSCYDREIFPTLEQAIEWSWAGSKEEIEAVEFVLKRFFSLEDGLYVQKRIQVELDKFHETSKTNKRIAQERETKRKKKSTKRAPIVDEPPPNHKPLTTNQEPLTSNQEPAGSSDGLEIDSDLNKNTMADFENYDQMSLDQNGLVPLGTGECKSPFERFWEAYGKKEKRAACEKKWKSKKLDPMIDHLLADIKNRDDNCFKWRTENGIRQFKSGPLPYLNGELWNDAIQPYPIGGQRMTRQEIDQKSDDAWADFDKKHGPSGDIDGECQDVS